MLIGLPEVVHVVRADERHVEIARDRQQPGVDDALLLDALVLHLEEEIAGAEDVAVSRRGLMRLARLIGAQPGRDLTFEAAAEADEPAAVLRQQLLVDARLVVEPVGVARRDELDEVVEPLVGLGEQHEVVGGFAGLPDRSVRLPGAT